ncbi:MAG TPA: hypothetical protein VLF68_00045 [Candidatus Saccharimonadales bacterium]|nr:hypothetical protein [Candidatus Saccharimonadales bacterium]
MTSPDRPQFGANQPKEGETTLADKLNGLFEQGVSAYSPDAQALLREIEHPIVIDLNGVLISDQNNDEGEKYPHPQAFNTLQKLSALGTVFLCTISARPWDEQKDRFGEWGLWNKDIVLMTPPNWQPPHFGFREKREHPIITSYIEQMQQQGRDYQADDFLNPGINTFKRIAPLFGRSFDVPIIDDASGNTITNPGMKGFLVTPFGASKSWTENALRYGSKPIEEIIEQVVDYYQNLKSENDTHIKPVSTEKSTGELSLSKFTTWELGELNQEIKKELLRRFDLVKDAAMDIKMGEATRDIPYVELPDIIKELIAHYDFYKRNKCRKQQLSASIFSCSTFSTTNSVDILVALNEYDKFGLSLSKSYGKGEGSDEALIGSYLNPAGAKRIYNFQYIHNSRFISGPTPFNDIIDYYLSANIFQRLALAEDFLKLAGEIKDKSTPISEAEV